PRRSLRYLFFFSMRRPPPTPTLFPYTTLFRSIVGPGEKLADLQAVRTDPVDRRDRAVEDVVEALELAGPLEGEDVERLLDDAEAAGVAARVAADRAGRLVADVEAAPPEHDPVGDGGQRAPPRA